MGVLDKKFNIMSFMYAYIDKPSAPASSTVNAAAAKGATTLTIAAASTFANGMDIRVGTGETQERCRIASGGGTTTLTLAKPLTFDHVTTEPTVEQNALNLGVPEADGLRLTINGETTDIFSAVSRLAYGVLTGYVDVGGSFRFPFLTIDAIALALGIPRANVIGDGTAVQQTGTVGPRLFTTDGSLFGQMQNVGLCMLGQLNDGNYFKLDFYNVSFDPTALTMSFARGALTTVPARFLASSASVDFTTTAFVPATIISTNAGSKADVVAEINAAQYLTPSGTSNTLASQATAGAYVLALTSATGFAAGDFVEVTNGDATEYHEVHAVATNNLNLRTQVLRTLAAGLTVKKMVRNDLNIAQGGVTIAASGSVETQRSELFRNSLAYRPLNVALTISGNLDAMKPDQWYTALGIPSTEYANLLLPLSGKISSDSAKPILLKGLTQGAKYFTAVLWNSSAQIGGEIQFTAAASAQLPFAFKPNAVQMYVNP